MPNLVTVTLVVAKIDVFIQTFPVFFVFLYNNLNLARILTYVIVGSAQRNMKASRRRTNSSRRLPITRGYSSQRAVIMASRPPKVLSRPRVMSIRKKMMLQKTEPLIVAIASGYTIKTKPGPSRPTLSMDVFCT